MAAEGSDRGVVSTCPCNRKVPLDYSTRDRLQAEVALLMIERKGEWVPVTVGARTWRVSRHCIALHGVKAEEIESYGFDELGGDDDVRNL